MEVLERIQKNLQGWESRYLSMVARATLIKYVTSIIPSYVMKTSFIPKGTSDQIYKC